MTEDTPPSEAAGPNGQDWPLRLAELAAEEPTPRRRELRRLADATRRVLHTMVMNGADAEELGAAADALEAVADDLHRHAQPGHSIFEGFGEASTSGDPHGFFDHSPMLGVANPIAPPITMTTVDERTMIGEVTFGAAYEGPPGCVHGGFIAAAFDEVLGAVQSRSGQPGMTGTLVVRYCSPTPLHEPLRFTGRFERVEGRKILTTGTLHAGDRLCAESDGIFVSVDFARMAELREQRAEQQARRGSEDLT
jgi:acyl-coenzyme A thioesterase PaaI-like protein